MNILDNELVLKYFGCTTAHYRDMKTMKLSPCYCLSIHVLNAMQQPIRKGERILVIESDDSIRSTSAVRDADHIHPFDLRLPDAFQKQPHICNCEFCRSPETFVLGETPEEYEKCTTACKCKSSPSPEKCACVCHTGLRMMKHSCCCEATWEEGKPKDAVEEKIERLTDIYKGPFDLPNGWITFKEELRELVRLARETK